jgi:hypothetical protein
MKRGLIGIILILSGLAILFWAKFIYPQNFFTTLDISSTANSQISSLNYYIDTSKFTYRFRATPGPELVINNGKKDLSVQLFRYNEQTLNLIFEGWDKQLVVENEYIYTPPERCKYLMIATSLSKQKRYKTLYETNKDYTDIGDSVALQSIICQEKLYTETDLEPLF